MRTKQDYEIAATRYMCMREADLLSQLTEAHYIDNLKMIGITWHGPQDPASELETVRDCEHPHCKWQWGPFVDGIRTFEPGRGILDDGSGQPHVVMVCHALEPVKCPACDAREAMHNAPPVVTVAMFSKPATVDFEALQRLVANGGADLVARRVEALREDIRRKEARGWYP
jgi:hypothetical protein